MKKIIVLLGLLLIASGMFWSSGFRINTTDSIPKGLYRIVQKTPQKGDDVLFCPPNNPEFQEALRRGYISAGFCQGELGMVMKKIAAASGDRITINANGVWVNGKKWRDSTPYLYDEAGRSLPQIPFNNRLLTKDEYLLMGVHPASFDGRYFGIVKKNASFKTIKPIVWR